MMITTPRTAICQTCVTTALIGTTALLLQFQQPSETRAEPQQNETTDGLDDSIDRIAFEVTQSLGDRPAFVIWLFDESGSVTTRRTKVIERLQQLYPGGKRPHLLYSAVVGFGQDVHFLTPEPVDNFPSLNAAADQLKQNDSGVEMVFTAVVNSLDHWKNFLEEMKPVDVSIVIVTDERGDDSDRLEDAVEACRENNVRVFCLGNASLFGKEKGFVRYTYPDAYSEMIPVDSGPETAFPDVLDLTIWPHPSRDEVNRLSSGFGPWALERLCAASGGRYFIVEDTATQHFARAAVAKCMPDRNSLAEQQRGIEANAARRALVEAAQVFSRNYAWQPWTMFRADTPSTLRAELAEAQKTVAVLDDRLAQAEKTLRAGLDDHDQLTGTRWQAAFDLALGRVLACRARLDSLKSELARMKASPAEFENTENNTWSVRSVKDATTDRNQQAVLAITLLKRVATNFPGTPFTFIAEAGLRLEVGRVAP
ncbi:hypothetical protein GC176_06465 [bacterium]|nr:hypothetical protein [bacterium]